ncbi:uncharacterized protein BDZ99DRAFT_191420 [Mytilinidion resinicola]|uniref:Uncharacterized protein n=1 Tax=Mytilinidion resinicola TaxID=574789 RepID=A0A6A6Z3A4_9PEZI|nr:uncharacterized protein BDZ99DRAFT_191420 [Mytilinidion resinicola]KAF2815153.1 hypothetical protein BDZ99DRAFT_191420 [Mytilinidion resinicola]
MHIPSSLLILAISAVTIAIPVSNVGSAKPIPQIAPRDFLDSISNAITGAISDAEKELCRLRIALASSKAVERLRRGIARTGRRV